MSLSETNLITLEQQIQLFGSKASYKDHIDRTQPSTYELFVAILYKDLATISDIDFPANKNLYFNLSEDVLTTIVVGQLKKLGYDAAHGSNQGGSTDIRVVHNDFGYIWIGEAKIHNGNSYLLDGYAQLLTRYMPGLKSATEGAMLIYIQKQPNAMKAMERWNLFLTNKHQTIKGIKNLTVNHLEDGSLCFYSQHPHGSTAVPCRIKHIPFCIRHDPDDSSGRKAAKYRKSIGSK